MEYVFVLLYYMTIRWTLIVNSYIIVRNEDSQKVYLISNRWAREILHDATIKSFEYEPNELELISQNVLDQFDLGPPVTLIEKTAEHNFDESTRVALLKYSVLSNVTMTDVTLVCSNCCNPAIFEWNNKLLMIAEFYKSERLTARWLNSSEFAKNETSYLGITTIFDQSTSISDLELRGLDGRIIKFDENRFTISYCSIKINPFRITVVDVRLNTSTNLAQASYLHYGIIPDVDSQLRQKNWIPFLYNGSIFHIQNLNPLVVVSIYQDTQNPDISRAKVVSSAKPIVDMDWPFPQLRGGTNAILMGDYYLSFFHSLTRIEPFMFETYFFGAYTFSSSPPFKLLSMSYAPIVHEVFYTGPWFKYKYIGKHIDYCVYPSSFYIQDDVITLYIGLNDYEGYRVKISLQNLLANMQNLDN